MEIEDRRFSQGASVTMNKPKRAVQRPLTIPRAPNFATDARLGPRTFNNSGDISSKVSVSSSTSRAMNKKSLTVPRSPTFSAPTKSSYHRTYDPPALAPGSAHRDTIRDGLPKVATSKPRGPTIPVAPKFHSINQRPKPKSSEERELEEIARYRSNPYSSSKRMPSDNNENIPNAKRRMTFSPNKACTITRTTNFRSARKSVAKPEPTRSVPFKARPMPNFSQKQGGMSGVPRVVSRSVTTPQPFHLTDTSSRSKTKELTVSTAFSTGPDDLAESMSNLNIAKEVPSSPGFQDLSPITIESTFNTGASTTSVSVLTESKVEETRGNTEELQQ
jgi:hypothetical protein